MSRISHSLTAAAPAIWYDHVLLATALMAVGSTMAISAHARTWGRVANPAPMTIAPPQRLISRSKGEEMSSPAIEQSPMSGAHQSQYDWENADAASA